MQPEQRLGQAMSAAQKAWNEAKARMLANPATSPQMKAMRQGTMDRLAKDLEDIAMLLRTMK